MLAAQAWCGVHTSEEVANDAQYNASIAQFTTGHAAAQCSIVNLTTANATQQQQIAALKSQVSLSANNVGEVMDANVDDNAAATTVAGTRRTRLTQRTCQTRLMQQTIQRQT